MSTTSHMLTNQVKYEDEETAKAMSEFATIEEQLNDIEKYAMYFLEEESAEFAAEQLRLAEVGSYVCEDVD